MAKSEGAFVVAEFCERISVEGAEAEKEKLKSWFNEDVMGDLERLEIRGISVLLEKLRTLRQVDLPQSNGRKKRAK